MRAPGRERQRPRTGADERALRVGERPWRYLRPDHLPRVRPGLPRLRLERKVGRASGGALLGAALRQPDADRARARRLALRPRPARCHAAVCVGRVPVHAVRVELERERRAPAVPARVRLLARDVRARARPVRRPGLLGQVRRAAPGSALGLVSRRSATPTRGRALRAGLPRRDGARLLGAPARARSDPCRARVLGPDVRLPAWPRLTVLHLGLGRVSGLSGSVGAADGAEGHARRRGRSAACFPAQDGDSARRSDGLPARRLRARADALVLPVHPLVPSLRRVCAARSRSPAGARAAEETGDHEIRTLAPARAW